MIYTGIVHRFGDNVNTDDIIPARYLHTTDPKELARHCMEHIDPTFVKKVKHGDIMVAGKNFGCGSSREHAPIAIKALGISCVVAESFARIFFRNAINMGLAIVTSAEAAAKIKMGNKIKVNLKKGEIKNLSRKEKYPSDVYPPFIEKIIRRDGLMNSIAGRKK
ncbi:MAG: 3-isopropylmalate dehydratase small subunit [Candidatus Omnitrophica bacterium]|nr:3-isopropylmalate dehydratase small subunit [Candidatus Omnitrophota bacterium]